MIKMSLGIGNASNITIHDLMRVANVTEPVDFYVNVNNIVYEGWLFFLIMWGLFFLTYRVSQTIDDQPLINLMYSSAFLSIIGLFARLIPLINDVQFWIFPLLAIVLAGVNWAIKKT